MLRQNHKASGSSHVQESGYFSFFDTKKKKLTHIFIIQKEKYAGLAKSEWPKVAGYPSSQKKVEELYYAYFHRPRVIVEDVEMTGRTAFFMEIKKERHLRNEIGTWTYASEAFGSAQAQAAVLEGKVKWLEDNGILERCKCMTDDPALADGEGQDQDQGQMDEGYGTANGAAADETQTGGGLGEGSAGPGDGMDEPDPRDLKIQGLQAEVSRLQNANAGLHAKLEEAFASHQTSLSQWQSAIESNKEVINELSQGQEELRAYMAQHTLDVTGPNGIVAAGKLVGPIEHYKTAKLLRTICNNGVLHVMQPNGHLRLLRLPNYYRSDASASDNTIRQRGLLVAAVCSQGSFGKRALKSAARRKQMRAILPVNYKEKYELTTTDTKQLMQSLGATNHGIREMRRLFRKMGVPVALASSKKMAAEDKKYFVKASIVKLDLEVGKKGDIKMEPALLVTQDARLLAQRELDFQHETGIYRPVQLLSDKTDDGTPEHTVKLIWIGDFGGCSFKGGFLVMGYNSSRRFQVSHTVESLRRDAEKRPSDSYNNFATTLSHVHGMDIFDNDSIVVFIGKGKERLSIIIPREIWPQKMEFVSLDQDMLLLFEKVLTHGEEGTPQECEARRAGLVAWGAKLVKRDEDQALIGIVCELADDDEQDGELLAFPLRKPAAQDVWDQDGGITTQRLRTFVTGDGKYLRASGAILV